MRNIEALDKQLLASEFQEGKDLFNLLRERGYSTAKAAAMVYRAGFTDGKDTQRARANAAHKDLHLARTELRALQAAQHTDETENQPTSGETEGENYVRDR